MTQSIGFEMFRSKRKSNNNEDKINADGSLIKLRNVFKVYDTPAGRFTALNGVDLNIGTGEFVSIIGKSGSGKTTLINMLTGIDRPTTGRDFHRRHGGT